MTTVQFRRWMERMDYTLDDAERELGLSRRQIAYYRSGEHEVPKVVELACRFLQERKEQR